MARELLTFADLSLLPTSELAAKVDLLQNHHGSGPPASALKFMKEWKCGNCGYSHSATCTHCSWCGDLKKHPEGLKRVLAEASKKDKYAIAAIRDEGPWQDY